MPPLAGGLEATHSQGSNKQPKQPTTHFEVLAHIPLAFLSIQSEPQGTSIETGVDLAAATMTTATTAKYGYPASSSSGISSLTSTEEEMDQSEHGSLVFDESVGIIVGWPPNNRLQINCPDIPSWTEWCKLLFS